MHVEMRPRDCQGLGHRLQWSEAAPMRSTRVLVIASVATALACQDAGAPDRLLAPTSRALAARGEGSGGSGQQDTVRLVKRSSSLAADVSRSALIGPSGGTISVAAAGVQ